MRKSTDSQGFRTGALAFVVATLLAVWLAPAASAATTYYVSPKGSGSECSQTKPCNIVFALGSAASGDKVIVAGNEGSYGLPENPTLEVFVVPGGVTIEGAPGQPRPVFYAAGVQRAFQLSSGATMRSFEIHYLVAFGEAIYAQGNNTIERVLAESPSGVGCLFAPEVTLTDSVCAGNWGLFEFVGGGGNWPITLRNDTIWAKQIALDLGSNGPALTVNATNTIVHGDGEDVFAVDQGNGGHVSVVLSHSNFVNVKTESGSSVTAPGSGTNQTALPLLANPAAGDFHELAGSATIDMGANETANGPFDLDGNVRALAARILCSGPDPAITDIGAFEFVPVAPTCANPGGESSGQSMGTTPSPPVRAPETKISKQKLDPAADTATFKFTGSGTGPLRFECRLDKGKFKPCRSPRTYHHLTAGKHHFRVRAVGAGGADPTPARKKFVISAP